MPGANAQRHTRSERGITILEVVFAVVLLMMTTATLVSSNSFIYKSQGREAQRLGAAELANRLLLQYIDDKNSMPSESLPIEYSQRQYRWSMDERRVTVVYDPAAGDDEDNTSGIGPERVRLIVVRVWLGAESGGSSLYTDQVPSIVITRLHDPLGFEYRSPDTSENQLKSESGIRDILNEIINLQGGTGGGAP